MPCPAARHLAPPQTDGHMPAIHSGRPPCCPHGHDAHWPWITAAGVLLALGLLLAGCAGTPPADAPRTVAAVDLPRYLGTWYEIARLPNRFQDGGGRACEQVTATYTARPDGRIGVLNRCDDAGRQRVAAGQAYVVEGSGGARLRVSFFWPFYGDYWVLGLDPDYRWAVVGAPDRKYLWASVAPPGHGAGGLRRGGRHRPGAGLRGGGIAANPGGRRRSAGITLPFAALAVSVEDGSATRQIWRSTCLAGPVQQGRFHDAGRHPLAPARVIEYCCRC